MTLGPMLNMFGKSMRTIFKQEGITYTLEQMFILRVVRDCKETVVQQDLAEQFGKDKSSILRIVDSLEKEALIRRIVDPNDRRRNILEITYLGNQLTNRFYEIEMRVSEVLLRNIDEADLTAFYDVIAKIRSNAEEF